MTQPIHGLHEVLDRYEGLVVDLWGVMHNGKALFPAAVAALQSAKSAGKSVTLLSNAPRRRDAALDALNTLGLSRDVFDDLITSGEIAWQAIAAGSANDWGPRCQFFGAAKDVDMKAGLTQVEFVEDLADAQWILNVGPEAGHGDVTPFEPYIAEALARDLPMICANPDLIVQRGASLEICAGAVARAYADRGGKVTWFGKPHDTVYQAVYASNGLRPADLLAVGDSFKTDVRGANDQGMDVLYVNSGIHGKEIGTPMDMAKVAELAAANGSKPTYAAEALAP